jgi:hypothetical protein
VRGRRTFEGATGGSNGVVHIGLVAFGDVGEHLFGGRIEGLSRRTRWPSISNSLGSTSPSGSVSWGNYMQ